jgi:methionyl aminopeptidase
MYLLISLKKFNMVIAIKTEEQLEIMREAGKLLASVMHELEKEVRPGISTMQLDKLAEELVLQAGATPAFKGYGEPDNAFPATLCTSINEQIVHGIPDEQVILEEGDILKVDVGLVYQGFCADMARTFAVGKISEEAHRLIEVTEKAFWKGVKKIKDGAKLSEYSKAAQEVVESAGFSVVKNLVGHGIGEHLHEDPQIPNYYDKSFREVELKAGMALALEPMVNVGTYKDMIGEDGWVFITADGKLSAHYENTVIVTKNGVEVITA